MLDLRPNCDCCDRDLPPAARPVRPPAALLTHPASTRRVHADRPCGTNAAA